MKSGIPKRSLLHIIFFNDISAYIRNSNYLLFADNLDMYHSITNVEDCKLFWCDMHASKIALDCGIKINTGEPRVTSFTRQTNSVKFNCKLCNYQQPDLIALKILEYF
jgi:hypothetical protein